MTQNNAFQSLFIKYLTQIDASIKQFISQFAPHSNLKAPCEYALLNGGKRFRPCLVFMINEALGNKNDVSQAALGIELLHTASLIADDLPCMDNDDQRRDKPALHKVFGESTALLTTYALIAEGYNAVCKNAATIHQHQNKQEHCLAQMAVENISTNTGVLGATGGQALDLHPPESTLENLIDMIKKKTVSLFEISFFLGWILGGGNLNLVELVKKSAYHFGMAFQIVDDIQDMDQDKINNRNINIANLVGKEKAKMMVENELKAFEKSLKDLNIYSKELSALQSLLIMQI